MRSRTIFVLVCALSASLALLLLPGAAQAQLAPPGNSAIDQYRESIPEVTGDRVKGGDDTRTPDEVLGEQNAEALRALGPDGEAAAEKAVAGAPSQKADADEKAKVAKGQDGESDSGPLKVASLATGLSDSGGGLGPVLPLLILTAIVLFTGIAVGRWRRAAGRGE